MATQLQLRSLATEEHTLELSLAEVPIPTPAEDEVLVKIEAAPINPSDLGLLFGTADMSAAQAGGAAERPTVTAPIPENLWRPMANREGKSLPAGNEGGGTVVEAGGSPEAQALLGKTVGILTGATYSQYNLVKARQCLAMPAGVTPAESASCFVNPLTALGMVETMKREGFSALAHTAAASNLGQMLLKLCLADGIELVNIVRSQIQVDFLQSLGATHVYNSEEDEFMDELTEAISETQAYLAFDAVGGGKLANQILTCMEAAATMHLFEYTRYGSTQRKQVYIYGLLDTSPTILTRSYGLTWGLGGWLLTPFLQQIGPEATEQLRQRVAAEIKTTFASHYTREISLAEALSLDTIAAYERKATGEKYLINPNKGLA